MIDMVSYLSQFREETPVWLENHLQGEKITFKDIMSSRVAYYPGCGDDGSLMRVGNKSHSVHSFLYVDYGVRRVELEARIKNSISGYHPKEQIEWKMNEITAISRDCQTEYNRLGNPDNFFVKDEPPYYISVIMERNKDKDNSWGAEHFVVTFFFADGIDTYNQLFVKDCSKAPWLFLLQDHGWGGNYDHFGADGKLDRIIQGNHCYPQFVICGTGGGTRIWKSYEQVPDVNPIYDGMHQDKRNLFKFVEQ